MSTSHPLKSFQQKLHIRSSSFQDIEKIYIKCSQDLALDSMANRAKSMAIPCYELNSGHFPMLTAPEAFVNLLIAQI